MATKLLRKCWWRKRLTWQHKAITNSTALILQWRMGTSMLYTVYSFFPPVSVAESSVLQCYCNVQVSSLVAVRLYVLHCIFLSSLLTCISLFLYTWCRNVALAIIHCKSIALSVFQRQRWKALRHSNGQMTPFRRMIQQMPCKKAIIWNFSCNACTFCNFIYNNVLYHNHSLSSIVMPWNLCRDL